MNRITNKRNIVKSISLLLTLMAFFGYLSADVSAQDPSRFYAGVSAGFSACPTGFPGEYDRGQPFGGDWGASFVLTSSPWRASAKETASPCPSQRKCAPPTASTSGAATDSPPTFCIQFNLRSQG